MRDGVHRQTFYYLWIFFLTLACPFLFCSETTSGTREILDIFNPRAFVFYDIDNPEPAIQRIQQLESNQTAYEQTMAQPILANGNATINKYFSLTPDIGDGSVMKRIHEKLGLPVTPDFVAE